MKPDAGKRIHAGAGARPLFEFGERARQLEDDDADTPDHHRYMQHNVARPAQCQKSAAWEIRQVGQVHTDGETDRGENALVVPARSW